MRAFSYTWPLPVTWQRWRTHVSFDSPYEKNPANWNFNALCFTVIADCGNNDFQPFCSCDLDLNPMIFMYKSDQYRRDIPDASRLSKVIVWQTDGQTDGQTDWHDRNYSLYHDAWRVIKEELWASYMGRSLTLPTDIKLWRLSLRSSTPLFW